MNLEFKEFFLSSIIDLSEYLQSIFFRMNYTSFIIKIISKPKYTLCDQKIPLTEALGKFYQFRNNPHTICKLSFWGRPAYEILKYYKTNEYVLVEGYISSQESTFEKFDITTDIEISISKVYPFTLKTEHIKK